MPLIQKGSHNTKLIKQIQSKLNLPIDGIFGDNTEVAVKEFQRSKHLISDGVIGILTYNALFNEVKEQQPSSQILSLRAIEIAKTQLYVREKTGHNDGKEVEQYLKDVGLYKGLPWCMSFIYWCFDKAANALNRDNPIPKTGGVLDCWDKAKGNRIALPEVGAQFIMDFGGYKGHTGIVTELRDNHIITIEGNTSADSSLPSEDREGNGVFMRLRKISSIKGYLRYT